jgi:hypothetical protein
MSAFKIALVLIAIGVFVLIVLLMIRAEKSDPSKKRARAEQLGFVPLVEVPSSVQKRAEWLHTHRPTQVLEIRNLAVLERNDFTAFILDILDVGSGEVTALQEDTILVISPELSLPRFTMISKILQGGILWKWVNKALQSLVERQGYELIQMGGPGFNESFLVFTEHPAQTSSFFERIPSSSLPRLSYVTIEAGGDAFSYGQLPLPSQAQSSSQALQSRLQEAERWYQLFRSARS